MNAKIIHTPQTIRVADVKTGQLFYQTCSPDVILARLTHTERLKAQVKDNEIPCVVIADVDEASQDSYLPTGEIIVISAFQAVVLLRIKQTLEVETV